MPPVRNSIDRPDTPPRLRAWARLASVRRIRPRRLRLRLPRPATPPRHLGVLGAAPASSCAGERARRSAGRSCGPGRSASRTAGTARRRRGPSARPRPARWRPAGSGCRAARRRRRVRRAGSSPPASKPDHGAGSGRRRLAARAPASAAPRQRRGGAAGGAAGAPGLGDALTVELEERAARAELGAVGVAAAALAADDHAAAPAVQVRTGHRQRLARPDDAMGHLPRLLDQQRVLGDGAPAPDRRHRGAADVVGRGRRRQPEAVARIGAVVTEHPPRLGAVAAEAHGARPQLRQQADLDELVGGVLDVPDLLLEHPPILAAVEAGERPDRRQRRARLEHGRPRGELAGRAGGAARRCRCAPPAPRASSADVATRSAAISSTARRTPNRPRRSRRRLAHRRVRRAGLVDHDEPLGGQQQVASARAGSRAAMSRSARASSSRSVAAAWAMSPATGTTAWHSEWTRGSLPVARGDPLGRGHRVRARRADLVGARDARRSSSPTRRGWRCCP